MKRTCWLQKLYIARQRALSGCALASGKLASFMIKINFGNERILIFAFFMLIGCKPNQRDTIRIVNENLNSELNDFIDYLTEDTFQLDSTVVIKVSKNNGSNLVSMVNRTPTDCKDLIGACYRRNFSIYVISDRSYDSLFEKLLNYKCPFDKRDEKPGEPVAFHFRERFFILQNDTLSIIRVP